MPNGKHKKSGTKKFGNLFTNAKVTLRESRPQFDLNFYKNFAKGQHNPIEIDINFSYQESLEKDFNHDHEIKNLL